jgi:hypothetical protein
MRSTRPPTNPMARLASPPRGGIRVESNPITASNTGYRNLVRALSAQVLARLRDPRSARHSARCLFVVLPDRGGLPSRIALRAGRQIAAQLRCLALHELAHGALPVHNGRIEVPCTSWSVAALRSVITRHIVREDVRQPGRGHTPIRGALGRTAPTSYCGNPGQLRSLSLTNR